MLKWARRNFSLCYKISTFYILLGCLLLIPAASFAQGVPNCTGDDDPYDTCPLDTYVWLLAIIALIFGAVYLYRQQKEQSRA